MSRITNADVDEVLDNEIVIALNRTGDKYKRLSYNPLYRRFKVINGIEANNKTHYFDTEKAVIAYNEI